METLLRDALHSNPSSGTRCLRTEPRRTQRYGRGAVAGLVGIRRRPMVIASTRNAGRNGTVCEAKRSVAFTAATACRNGARLCPSWFGHTARRCDFGAQHVAASGSVVVQSDSRSSPANGCLHTGWVASCTASLVAMGACFGAARRCRIADGPLGHTGGIPFRSKSSDGFGWRSHCGSVWLGTHHRSHVLPHCGKQLAPALGYHRMGVDLCVMDGRSGAR
ncbi:unannotated protein [freshwater metagenome]|uniref:Unannotated protein n=1 Tax=freshwater metagenome TaxID=449393 RepID=A0A6J7HNK8_9ZZZZ